MVLRVLRSGQQASGTLGKRLTVILATPLSKSGRLTEHRRGESREDGYDQL